MPTAKGKGGSTSHRYRPASQYDDATLAQKREYWRTKKREQRARLSERRGKPQDSHREKVQHLNATVLVNSSLSGSFDAPTFQRNDELNKTASVSPASHSGRVAEDSSLEVTESQKEKWFHTMKLNKVLPQLPATCSITARATDNTATVKCLTARGSANKVVTSPTPSGTQMDTNSSVPPVRVTRFSNGSSAKTTPQPCESMQGPSIPKIQHKAQVALRIQPKLLPTNVTTGMIHVSSPCGPVSFKRAGKTANTAPQSRKKSALVTMQRAKGNVQPSLDSEEERAAKRREHWRIKKREQRAKLASRITKARERTQCIEIAVQRQTLQKAGLVSNTGLQHLSSESVFPGQGRKQYPTRVKTLFTRAKKENDKLQSRANPIKVQCLHGNMTAQTAITSDVTAVKKTGELQIKFPSHVHLSNVTRGIARCKTPRQRFIEAQRILMSQRNVRCKTPLLASLFGTRNMPRIDPNDTPEQVLAKRREYWRIKKREQRAKLSMEVKARLKEKDSLMRRVKRYQKILEEMRKARALTQSAGRTLAHASETIGGFIKEDGTVTINIPQGLTGHNTAAHKSKEENCLGSKSTPVTPPQHQHQPNAEPLCSAQVKVSIPLAGQSKNKPTRTPHEITSNSHSLAIRTVGQLTLTHPQTSLNTLSGGCTTGTNLGGCIMKMAVSNSSPSLSVLSSLDPGLTEEERMAKKREYWRIKKREQRAARAARLKQGVLHARANAALQRRKAQKHLALINVQLSRSLTSHTRNSKPHPQNSEPVTTHANEIKQESESVPAVDLNSQPEQAICPDIKPPTSPPPPPVPPPESDTALSADSHATTLLAVASMKKLLEESLSTVTESQSEQVDIKMETTEEASDVKPNLPQLIFEKDEVAPIAADLTLQIKSWQPDIDALVHTGSPSPHMKDWSHLNETVPPHNTSNEVVLHPTSEHFSQTTSDFVVNPSNEATNGPSSPRRTQRLRTKKASHQNCCSPEPPKLHHLPMDQLHPAQCEAQEQCQNSNVPPAQRHCHVMMEQSSLTSLQKKREYWKLMKRQQRARLKARQKETQGECSSRLSSRNIQAPGLVVINTVKGINLPAKPLLQSKPSVACLTAIPSMPPVLVTSPTTCNAEQSPDTLQVTLPINSVSCSLRNEQVNMNTGSSQITSNCLGAPGSGSQKWMSRSTDIDSAPSLPPLTPPDNPLSSINLQPIELPGQTPNSTLSPIKIPCAQLQSPTHTIQPPTKLVHISTMVPPKLVPGETEEDFLRRKREYWRIKKKEQRARKAIRDKGISPRRVSDTWRPILPAHDLQTQDLGQWVNSTEDSDHLLSSSVDTNTGLFPCSNYTAPVEDESEVLFADYENNDGEEGPVSDAMWRNRYLMDYDPLNQLLVCMVCGDLQYSHSLEAVRAHIDEAHPETLTLEPGERQRMLEAWDEQVSQRERFFTSQLQQHSGSLAEAQRD